MRGAASSWYALLLLLVLPLLSEGAPAKSDICRSHHLPEGGHAANCSLFGTGRHRDLFGPDLHRNDAELPTDLRSLRVLPETTGLASFLEERLRRHAHHLEELYLADNEVVGTRLRSLRGLHKLRVLDLSFCDVSNADQVASLVKGSGRLESLRLSGNSLPSLPALTSDSLVDLDVSDCGVASVRPDAFSRLKRLRHLNLARNRLTNLAADLPHSLRFLDLSGNSLTHLSPKVVSGLQRVQLSGNPLHCTCTLLRLRDEHTGDHVAVGAGAACTAPEPLRGMTLSGARRLCQSRVGLPTGSRQRRQADALDLLEGSGGRVGDGTGEDEELDEETGDDFGEDEYDEVIDDVTGTDGADGVHESAPPEVGSAASAAPQLIPQDVELESSGGSSTAPPVPVSLFNTTRSLEDDIYEPTVPPPVPVAVDADADTAAQPPSETPPESGPPAAEAVEGDHAESPLGETGDVDGIQEPPEHKEESDSVAVGSTPDVEGEEKSGVKVEEGNTDVDDVFNEVTESEDEAVDANEDYDYDEELESTADEISDPYHITVDGAKEEPNETLASSSGTVDKKATLESTVLTREEESDKDYEENGTDVEEKANGIENTDGVVAVHEKAATVESTETAPSSLDLTQEEESDKDYKESGTDVEEKANEVENTDVIVAVPAKAATAESTETAPSSLDTVHQNQTSDSALLTHDAELHEDAEKAGADVKIVGESEGSGEGDSEDTVPIGPITGFIDTNEHDGATTTEEPDEGTLLIDEGEDESNSPLIPPGETGPTDENVVVEPDFKIALVGNETEKETGVSEQDEGEEEGSGMSIGFGGGDWDIEKANETDEEPEVTSLGQSEIHEDDLIVHQISMVESGREMQSSSDSPLTTTPSKEPGVGIRLFHFNTAEEEAEVTSETPAHTAMPVDVGAGEVSSTAPPEVEHAVPAVDAEHKEPEIVEEHIIPAAPVPVAEAVPSEEPATPPEEATSPSPPIPTSELPVPEWGDTEVEAVTSTGDTPYNDTARVVVAGSENPPEESPLNSAGSYVVLGIIMALVVFLLGYAVMRSRRGRQRAAAKASAKDAEAAGGQQEGRELKEISKPLLGTPATVPAANGKGDHLQPLVTKPTDNPDLKDDDGDEPAYEKPLLEPKTHIYETLNGGEKERVPVHPPSPKKSPSSAPPAGGDSGDAVDSSTPPVPEKRRVLSRLPETGAEGAPNMYAADGLPGEVVAQQPTANGAATSPVNGLSTFAPPVSPSSGRVKVVAREDPDSVPKKPVFVVNQGPSAASGVV